MYLVTEGKNKEYQLGYMPRSKSMFASLATEQPCY